MQPRQIALLMALLCKFCCEHCELVLFREPTTDMPGTRPALAVVHFDLSRARSILEEVTRLLVEIDDLLDQKRSIFAFLRELIDRRTPVDNLLLFSPSFLNSESQVFSRRTRNRRDDDSGERRDSLMQIFIVVYNLS